MDEEKYPRIDVCVLLKSGIEKEWGGLIEVREENGWLILRGAFVTVHVNLDDVSLYTVMPK
jgi:hypothetical protein